VTLLLLAVIAIGLKQGLTAGNGFALFQTTTYTVTSTVTSTSYRYWRVVTILFARLSEATIAKLTQWESREPYLEFSAEYVYLYDLNSTRIRAIDIVGVIKNLMEAHVEKGTIILCVTDSKTSSLEEHEIHFREIRPGESIDIRERISLSGTYTRDNIRLLVSMIVFTCKLTETPISSRVETITGSHTTTYTTTFTTDKVLFLIGTAEIEMTLLAVFSVVLVVFCLHRIRRRETIQVLPCSEERDKLYSRRYGRMQKVKLSEEEAPSLRLSGNVSALSYAECERQRMRFNSRNGSQRRACSFGGFAGSLKKCIQGIDEGIACSLSLLHGVIDR